MTELEILTLQSMNNQSTGAYQIAMAFTIWVAFRASNLTSQQYADNIGAKIAATVFGLGAVFYLNLTYAFYSFNMASTGHRLADLQAGGGEISALAVNYIANTGASTTPPAFSLIPSDPVMIAFELAILAMILVPLWGRKKA